MATIKIRRGTDSVFSTNNPTLAQGEAAFIFASGANAGNLGAFTGDMKVGDGVTPYNSLPVLKWIDFAQTINVSNFDLVSSGLAKMTGNGGSLTIDAGTVTLEGDNGSKIEITGTTMTISSPISGAGANAAVAITFDQSAGTIAMTFDDDQGNTKTVTMGSGGLTGDVVGTLQDATDLAGSNPKVDSTSGYWDDGPITGNIVVDVSNPKQLGFSTILHNDASAPTITTSDGTTPVLFWAGVQDQQYHASNDNIITVYYFGTSVVVAMLNAATISGSGVPEAPEDSTDYVRRNATWVPANYSAVPVGEAPTDGQDYVRRNSVWAVANYSSGGGGGSEYDGPKRTTLAFTGSEIDVTNEYDDTDTITLDFTNAVFGAFQEILFHYPGTPTNVIEFPQTDSANSLLPTLGEFVAGNMYFVRYIYKGDYVEIQRRDITTGQVPVPGGFALTPGDTQITVGWNAVVGASGYRVERSADGSTGWTTEYSGPNLTYTDTGLTNGTTYYYRVRAVLTLGAVGTYQVFSDYTTVLNETPNVGSLITIQLNFTNNANSGNVPTGFNNVDEGSGNPRTLSNLLDSNGDATTVGYRSEGFNRSEFYDGPDLSGIDAALAGVGEGYHLNGANNTSAWFEYFTNLPAGTYTLEVVCAYPGILTATQFSPIDNSGQGASTDYTPDSGTTAGWRTIATGLTPNGSNEIGVNIYEPGAVDGILNALRIVQTA